MPNTVIEMPMLVTVVMFTTGRMAFRLKTGERASSTDGVSGLEQFSMVELY